MSIDNGRKCVTADLGQTCLSRFGDESLFEIDCEGCVEFVTGRGQLDDAKNYARWHIESRGLCEAVVIVDPDTGEKLARVTETDFEWLRDGPVPPSVGGPQ